MTSRSEAGQTTVELIALLPVLATVLVALAFVVGGQRAHVYAEQAAVAAAVAQLQGLDADAAARTAVPRWARPRIRRTKAQIAVDVSIVGPAILGRRIRGGSVVSLGSGR